MAGVYTCSHCGKGSRGGGQINYGRMKRWGAEEYLLQLGGPSCGGGVRVGVWVTETSLSKDRCGVENLHAASGAFQARWCCWRRE